MAQYEQNISSFLNDIAEDKKRQNTSSAENAIRNYHNFFQGIILPEMKKLDKCISRFSQQEIINVFAGRKLTFTTAKRYFGYIQDYLKWLHNHDFDSTAPDRFTTIDFETHPLIEIKNAKTWYDFYSLIQRQEGATFTRQYFRNEEHFMDYMRTVFSSVSTGTSDNTRYDTYLAVVYLIWLGFTIDEIVALKATDFNMESKTINEIPIENETIQNFLEYYLKTPSYNRLNKNGTFSNKNYLENEGYFIKTGFSHSPTRRLVSEAGTIIQKLCGSLPVNNEYYKVYYSLKNIQKSGIFHRRYLKEKMYSLEPPQTRAIIAKEVGVAGDSGTMRGLYQDYLNWKKSIH